jgi:hypothetical protein
MAEGLLFDDFKIFILVLGVGIVKNRIEEKMMALKNLMEESNEKDEKNDLMKQIRDLSRLDDVSKVIFYFKNVN